MYIHTLTYAHTCSSQSVYSKYTQTDSQICVHSASHVRTVASHTPIVYDVGMTWKCVKRGKPKSFGSETETEKYNSILNNHEILKKFHSPLHRNAYTYVYVHVCVYTS